MAPKSKRKHSYSLKGLLTLGASKFLLFKFLQRKRFQILRVRFSYLPSVKLPQINELINS